MNNLYSGVVTTKNKGDIALFLNCISLKWMYFNPVRNKCVIKHIICSLLTPALQDVFDESDFSDGEDDD